MKHPAPHIRLGMEGERIAARQLEAEGMDILCRNLKLEHAQVDLVARDGETFVIVEVKTMRIRDDVEVKPWLQLHDEQKDRLIGAGFEFRKKFRAEAFPLRFDLVEVYMGRWFPRKVVRREAWFSHRTFRKRNHIPFSLKPEKTGKKTASQENSFPE